MPERRRFPLENLRKTATQQALMMGAKIIANSVFERLNIPHGNKAVGADRLIERLRDHPVEWLITTGVLGPTVEEFASRLLPSALIDRKDRRMRWDIGIPMAAIFALGHNFKRDEEGELRFLKSVPISQFMGGLFYWYLLRERGYKHSVLAHSMQNSIPFSIGALLFRIMPDEKAERIVRRVGKNIYGFQ